MLRALTLLLIVLAAGLPAWAEEPSGPDMAADAVARAFEASDASALESLAARKSPERWLVVDALCARKAFAAAEAFARAAPEKDGKALAAYVSAAAQRAPRPAERELLATVTAAVKARDAKTVIEKTEGLSADLDSVVRIRLLHTRARALRGARRPVDAEQALEAAGDAAWTLGWLLRADHLLHEAGMTAVRRFAWDRASVLWTKRLDVQTSRGDGIGAARTRSNLGSVARESGDFEGALKFFEAALQGAQAAEDAKLAAGVLGNLGIVHDMRGDYRQALIIYERALKQIEAAGDRRGATVILGNIGAVHDQLGNLTRALSIHQRVHEQRLAMGDRLGAAEALGDIGSVRHGLGDYGRALTDYESAIQQLLALGDRDGAARTIGNLSGLYLALGDMRKALAASDRAQALHAETGNRAGAALVLGNRGVILATMGDFEGALEVYEEARAQLAGLGRDASATSILANMGTSQLRLGRSKEALATLQEALRQYEKMRSRAGEGWTRLSLARAHQNLGDAKEARSLLRRVERQARRLRDTPLLVEALRSRAVLNLRTGEAREALRDAEDALEEVENLLGGLGEERGASARQTHASLFAAGTLAAIRDDDPAAAVTFLESGRAGALLDALGKREALRWKAETLSPELRKADDEARVAEAAARRAYDAAVRRGRLKEVRTTGAALDRASEAVRDVAGRIQRELKHQAGLYYPRAETIEAIQEGLRADQALVLYGLCLDEALAVVLRRDAVRAVALGAVAEVVAACKALDVTQPGEASPEPAIAALRDLLIAPLALDDTVKQVLISPEGPLCYVPFGALLDRPVALTPSGTTHLLLRDLRDDEGEGILALGDPDYSGVSEGAQAIYYRGNELARLPATRVEAKTVGSTVLLGKDASEAALPGAIAGSKRWRAVHLACHGLVNVDKPMLSSLALSRGGEDDGFLTALEILRMRVPADLAVLSACETGKGQIVKGEGIVGLTRAFMFAGAPRVLCSLWKVDDEATRELMVKFYELWAPKTGTGLPAAAALRRAQAHVRAQPKWKHPYYWAAWVLWGLPD
ncbi:MAG: CHAT domain-containing protein [Planctomycetota bacterium]|nr:CHAT domain-containing protein [Planctomycetota bacterium]